MLEGNMKENKNKGLWYNINKRREKGLPKKKPGQKGYPKTLDINESRTKKIIRQEILREMSNFAGADQDDRMLSDLGIALEDAQEQIENLESGGMDQARQIIDDLMSRLEEIMSGSGDSDEMEDSDSDFESDEMEDSDFESDEMEDSDSDFESDEMEDSDFDSDEMEDSDESDYED
jgi:hypothetical protein